MFPTASATLPILSNKATSALIMRSFCLPRPFAILSARNTPIPKPIVAIEPTTCPKA